LVRRGFPSGRALGRLAGREAMPSATCRRASRRRAQRHRPRRKRKTGCPQ
jgi:hypothetical protein